MKPSILYTLLTAACVAGGCSKQTAEAQREGLAAKEERAVSSPALRPPTFSEFAVPPKPAVTPELLARGKTVYGQNCAACHGVNGDGKGDAAAFLAPKPRNFVQANYRLRSTPTSSLPTDVDLFKEISLGVPGTPMPPWKHMIADDDRWALVEYVKSFSPRFSDTNEVRVAIADFGTPPARSAATIAEGKELYAKMNCFTCHGDTGRGDGLSAPTLVDDSENRIRPRDFANPGAFKSGYATKEIVRTILTGFNGTPMVGFDNALKKEDAWKLAYFVETLAKPTLAGPVVRESQNFLAREELGAPDVKIKLTERAWQYDPSVIRVKKGQVVEITFNPTDNGLGVGHGFAISSYDEAVFLNGVMAGVGKTAKFRADHAGKFIFYCSTQCSTEKLHPLMNGTLIVEDDAAPKQTASIE